MALNQVDSLCVSKERQRSGWGTGILSGTCACLVCVSHTCLSGPQKARELDQNWRVTWGIGQIPLRTWVLAVVSVAAATSALRHTEHRGGDDHVMQTQMLEAGKTLTDKLFFDGNETWLHASKP